MDNLAEKSIEELLELFPKGYKAGKTFFGPGEKEWMACSYHAALFDYGKDLGFTKADITKVVGEKDEHAIYGDSFKQVLINTIIAKTQ